MKTFALAATLVAAVLFVGVSIGNAVISSPMVQAFTAATAQAK